MIRISRQSLHSLPRPLVQGKYPRAIRRTTGNVSRLDLLRRYGAVFAALGLMGAMTPAIGGIHQLGEVTEKVGTTSLNIDFTASLSGHITDTVIFELSREKDLVLAITPDQHQPSMPERGQLAAALWTQDGELLGTLGSGRQRLVRHLGAGTYQLRIDGSAKGQDRRSYTLSIGPRTEPKPKLWAMLALGVAILSLQAFHGSRATSRQSGAFRFRLPS